MPKQDASAEDRGNAAWHAQAFLHFEIANKEMHRTHEVHQRERKGSPRLIGA